MTRMLSTSEELKILELKSQGWSNLDIARLLKRGECTVWKVIRRGVPRTEEERAWVIERTNGNQEPVPDPTPEEIYAFCKQLRESRGEWVEVMDLR